jgi:hypothetical protein
MHPADRYVLRFYAALAFLFALAVGAGALLRVFG